MKTEINGINIDYRDEGDGLPIVFIHAFPLNQSMWDEQVATLSADFRTITLDLRGFGKSDAPEGSYSMDQMAADVHGLMSALSIESAVLVGLSMGGYISLAFQRNYPESVRAMVLANTRAGIDTSEGRGRRMKSAEKAEREGVKAIADDMVAAFYPASRVGTRREVVARVRLMIEGNSPRGIAAAQRGMAQRMDSTPVLPRLACPVLLIAGAVDELTPIEEAEVLRSGIRRSGLRLIDNAGHLSNLDQPEAFNAAVREFLGSLEWRP
ncbi:MAG TPA: alpha/beta hydrolase [Blastocatellia bacterium]|nr:alpha/beta hydrolase [Blastocatellia bacterium]